MSKDLIIRAWKNKKFSASLGKAAPANPAGSSNVSLQDLEMSALLTSPLSVCSIGPRCQCG